MRWKESAGSERTAGMFLWHVIVKEKKKEFSVAEKVL